MASANYICTHCGYEGRPIRPPSDEAYAGQSDASKALASVANLVLPGAGLLLRPLAMFITLPIKLILWPLKRAANGPRTCSNCGLPTMVKKSSDAGYVALRKMDLKEGKRFDRPEAPVVAFGKEIALPGDEDKNAKPAPPPPLEKLPSLEVLLQETPIAQPQAQPEQAAEPQPQKKPVDPDQW